MQLLMPMVVMGMVAMVTASGNMGHHAPMAPMYVKKLVSTNGGDPCQGTFVCEPAVNGMRGVQDCISMKKVCDGIKDCLNAADEKNCGPICAKDEYKCSDGKACAKLCDGNWECSSGEDEKHCNAQCTCPVGSYQCKGEDKCIPLPKVCDGVSHCRYDDDECHCEGCQCGPGQLRCTDSNKCVDPEHICDNIEDCPCGDDEKDCPAGCKCGPNQFLCPNSHHCIESHELCENNWFEFWHYHDHDMYDCPGREDESDELCRTSFFGIN